MAFLCNFIGHRWRETVFKRGTIRKCKRCPSTNISTDDSKVAARILMEIAKAYSKK